MKPTEIIDILLASRKTYTPEENRASWNRFFELTTRPGAEFDSTIDASMLPAFHRFITENCPVTTTRIIDEPVNAGTAAIEFLGLYMTAASDTPILISYITCHGPDGTYIEAHMLETEHYLDAVFQYFA